MREEPVHRFKITPSQYELFRLSVNRPTTVNIELLATAPVNVLLLNSDEKAEYEKGENATHPYTVSFGRKSNFEQPVNLDPGTWYLVVERSSEPSQGRIKVTPVIVQDQ